MPPEICFIRALIYFKNEKNEQKFAASEPLQGKIFSTKNDTECEKRSHHSFTVGSSKIDEMVKFHTGKKCTANM